MNDYPVKFVCPNCGEDIHTRSNSEVVCPNPMCDGEYYVDWIGQVYAIRKVTDAQVEKEMTESDRT